MRIYFLIAFLIVVFSADMMGQQSLSRTKKLAPVNDTLTLDTLSLVTSTIKLYSNGNLLDTSFYKIIPERKQVVFNGKRLAAQHISLDTISAFYQVFPVDFNKEAYHKDIKELQRDISIPQKPYTIKFNNDKDAQNFFASDGLTKNGSISRGISFGNNQDMVVNSNLNLQIAGKLTKDIEVSLAATDNNIPVQPEGNTQQLQEFDKVFIQLKDKKSKLIVGDYQMQKPQGYFLNFYKRAQGLYFTNDYEIAKGAVLKTTVSGAITGGRFARNVIQATESNQGPYRLTGADGELYIVVLSGTERVFINGVQLKRGQENDYVVDYNSGQITFTAKQLITKDKRIEVEFQYSVKSYSRSVYFVNEEVQTKKVRVAVSYYDEQDNKNKSLQQTLSDTDKVILYKVGDTLNKAFTNGYSMQAFNSTEVFYKRIDSTNTTGTYAGIFVYTSIPYANDSAYKVNFSNVGVNNGNYIQIQSPANGVVYEWVQPIGNVKQGSFEPIIPLVAPTKKQMITALTEIKTSATGVFGAEGAFTNYDVNTLSPFDKKNDNGQGAKVYYSDKKKLGIEDTMGKQWALNYGGNYEYVQKNFTQVERFRSVEFFRDWNRTSDTIHNDQQIASLTAGLSKGNIFSTQYGANGFIEGNNYQAIKQNINNSLNLGSTNAFYNSSYLASDDNILKTNFYRHKSKLSQRVNKIVLSYQDEFENNQFKNKLKDSLLGKSYQFWEWEANMTMADSTKNKFKVFYRERTDKFGFNNYLKRAAYAQNIGFSTDISTLKNHPIRTTLTYRKLQIIDTNLIKVKPDNSLLSRIEYSPKLIKGFFQANSFYEVGYGLEQKQQYSYVQVAAGQGQYTWKDYNDDGIKQLNEFEIAQYSDQATYIRVYTPTNTYIKSVRDQFSFSVYLRPKVFLREDSKKIVKFASKFVSQTTYKVDQKQVASASSISQYNPFKSNLNDSTLLASNFSLRQALYFNQTSPIYGFDYTYEDNRTKQLITNGFESHRLQNNQLNTRWNITRAWGFFVTAIVGNKFNGSQYFATRNYQIQTVQAQPKISYQPSTAFRISLSYQYSNKLNVLAGGAGEKAVLNDFGAEFKLNKLSKGSLTFKADYINITYNSDQDTPIAFDMLNSLHAGQNITWSASFQQNMSGNIQISITYEGRKTPDYKLVNIGGAQIRAFF